MSTFIFCKDSHSFFLNIDKLHWDEDAFFSSRENILTKISLFQYKYNQHVLNVIQQCFSSFFWGFLREQFFLTQFFSKIGKFFNLVTRWKWMKSNAKFNTFAAAGKVKILVKLEIKESFVVKKKESKAVNANQCSWFFLLVSEFKRFCYKFVLRRGAP